VGELNAHFANCPILGEEYSESEGHRRLDTINFEHEGFHFRLVQQPDSLGFNAAHRDQFHHTTEVYVSEVKDDNLSTVHRLLHELSWLLSLATYSDVVYFGYDFPHGTTLGESWSVRGRLRYFRPMLETREGAVIRHYLKCVWPAFSALCESRKLNVIVHYILLADRPEQPLEAGLIFSFVALESLKSTFAATQNIPFVKRCFRKISNPPKARVRDEPCYSFEDLLQEMLAAVGIRNAVLNPIVQLRNEIIHNGISQQTHAANRHVYNACHDMLREYLLRLLGYKDAFWYYAHPNGTPGKI